MDVLVRELPTPMLPWNMSARILLTGTMGGRGVDLRLVCNSPDFFWFGQGRDNLGGADGSCGDGDLRSTDDGLGGGPGWSHSASVNCWKCDDRLRGPWWPCSSVARVLTCGWDVVGAVSGMSDMVGSVFTVDAGLLRGVGEAGCCMSVLDNLAVRNESCGGTLDFSGVVDHWGPLWPWGKVVDSLQWMAGTLGTLGLVLMVLC